ncbi:MULTISPECIES: ribbon-helix-helix domain-containing protein [unclassified Isoptericola]|uniref:ribbon-helix-helix domain-containing protein n=1 Tax=unclassified Isoptericola TaxID=2623355 RepID=UPI003668142A
MTTQIAVRLPDELVAWVDQQVAEGKTRSRASAVERALRREVRRQLAERDAQIYAATADQDDPDDLAGMVRWVEKNSSWDHLD